MLEPKLQAKDRELEQLREKAEEATSNALESQAELKGQSEEVSALRQELENSQLRAEVDKMRALERSIERSLFAKRSKWTSSVSVLRIGFVI